MREGVSKAEASHCRVQRNHELLLCETEIVWERDRPVLSRHELHLPSSGPQVLWGSAIPPL